MICSDDGRTDTQLPMLVTAAVDAIHLRKRLNLDSDIKMSGQVVWTGKSAMDIRMQLTQVRGTAFCCTDSCSMTPSLTSTQEVSKMPSACRKSVRVNPAW